MQGTEIASHRGGAFLWPENSLEAFRNTLLLPVDLAECDVQLSADGVPMVFHDATLDRMSEASGPVAGQPAARLERIRLRGAGGGCIPSLAAVAALFRGRDTRLQVELKTPARGQQAPLLEGSLAVLEAAGIRGQCQIIAFDAELAAAAQGAGGLAGVAWLFGRGLLRQIGAGGVIAVARTHGLGMVETEIEALDAELVGRLRGAGLRLGAWGANHAESIQKALGLGLDLMATDDPVLALRLRG